MAQPNTYTSISGKIIKETDAAILFKHSGISYWFPLSQICEIHRDVDWDTTNQGEEVVTVDQIKVADWLLVKKGISL